MQPLKEGQRYRCKACGNLTRFDVVRTLRLKGFHHFTIGGEQIIEEEDTLDEEIISVECRWCSDSKAIEVIEGKNAM
jgi:hypothetical protein